MSSRPVRQVDQVSNSFRLSVRAAIELRPRGATTAAPSPLFVNDLRRVLQVCAVVTTDDDLSGQIGTWEVKVDRELGENERPIQEPKLRQAGQAPPRPRRAVDRPDVPAVGRVDRGGQGAGAGQEGRVEEAVGEHEAVCNVVLGLGVSAFFFMLAHQVGHYLL